MCFHFGVFFPLPLFFCTLAMKRYEQSFILIASAVNLFMNKLYHECAQNTLYISTLIYVFTLTTQENGVKHLEHCQQFS